MSRTSVWIKEQFAKESPRIVTQHSLQDQVDQLMSRVKQLETDMAYINLTEGQKVKLEVKGEI
jgi:hypothetical protein